MTRTISERIKLSIRALSGLMPESTTLPDANLRTLLVSIDVHSGQSGFGGLQISVGVGPRPHTIIRDENFFRRSTGDRRHPSLRSAPFFPDRYGRPHESRFSLPGRNFNRWTHRGGGVGDIWRDHARDCRAAKTELTPRSDAFQPSSARSDGCPSWRFSGISTPKKTQAAVDGGECKNVSFHSFGIWFVLIDPENSGVLINWRPAQPEFGYIFSREDSK